MQECEERACQWILAIAVGVLDGCSRPSLCPGVPSTKPHLQHTHLNTPGGQRVMWTQGGGHAYIITQAKPQSWDGWEIAERFAARRCLRYTTQLYMKLRVASEHLSGVEGWHQCTSVDEVVLEGGAES